ncbi:MAG: HAMP domain-containing sensor histidine kinase [Oscillospiraceae bacterium]
MNGKKLTHSLLAKVIAIFLLCAFAILMIFCMFEIGYSEYCGYYSGVTRVYTQSPLYSASLYGDMTPTLAQSVFNLTFSMRYWAIALGVLSLLGFISCLIFLCCAVGHRGDTDEIFLNKMDLLPFDVYFVACAILIFCILSLTQEYYCYHYIPASFIFEALILFVVLLMCALLALTIFLTSVTRIKAGGWWRNTLIYISLRFCWRTLLAGRDLIKRVWTSISHGVPIVWRTAVVAASLLVADFAITMMLSHGGFFILLIWFLFNFFVFAAMCFAGLQMKTLKKAGESLAAGDFDYKIDTDKMYWEFKSHGENLNSIASGMAIAVNQKMKSERLKTELITNVSHDIKTPLTSIINYVDLLQKAHTPEESAEYLTVLDRQAHRLKKLTEDLVEASKASTGNMNVALVRVNTLEIINQSIAEYAERLTLGKIEVVVNSPEPPISVMADGRLLWRVIDNLFSNVCKYGMPGTRVYAEVHSDGSDALISLKNISRDPLNISEEELLERFVRGDSSRNTEGSGLGLNIAKSLTELQRGKFSISTDGDLFKAEIRLPLA